MTKSVVRLTDPPQSLVKIDKGSDTFTLCIPGQPESGPIEAEFLPELRDQLGINGGLLSCWSYMNGSPHVSSDDDNRSNPEEELEEHTLLFVEDVVSRLDAKQLQESLKDVGEEGAIYEILRSRLMKINDQNGSNGSSVH